MSRSPFALRTTPDHVLLEGLRKLAANDAALEAELLVHLGEVDARELALRKGFRSLHHYCVDELHFSEAVAWSRITAARAVRRFPEILERVRSGELHLSGLRLLQPFLTDESCTELLDLARHQSKRAIEVRLADRAPKPEVPAQMRRLPEPIAAPAAATVLVAPPQPPRAPAPVFIAPPRPEPLGGSRYRVEFTAGPKTHAKLVAAQALLRHQIPDGDLAALFDRALDALIREARRAKFGESGRPREAAEPADGPDARHIPAAIRREVAARDSEQCTFVSSDSRRCDARGALEFHHRIPFARAQRHRASEITLRCRAHNALAARDDFGAEHMARFARDRPSASTRPGTSADRSTGGDPGRT